MKNTSFRRILLIAIVIIEIVILILIGAIIFYKYCNETDNIKYKNEYNNALRV